MVRAFRRRVEAKTQDLIDVEAAGEQPATLEKLGL